MNRRLTAIVEREGDGYVALCPEVDVASQGRTVVEARDNLTEALALFFETAPADEVDRRLRGEVYVTQVEVTVGLDCVFFRDAMCAGFSPPTALSKSEDAAAISRCRRWMPTAPTVPVPDRRELRTGTLLSIIRQSGVPRSEFGVG